MALQCDTDGMIYGVRRMQHSCVGHFASGDGVLVMLDEEIQAISNHTVAYGYIFGTWQMPIPSNDIQSVDE